MSIEDTVAKLINKHPHLGSLRDDMVQEAYLAELEDGSPIRAMWRVVEQQQAYTRRHQPLETSYG